MEKHSSTNAYLGGIATVIGSMTLHDWGIIVGILVGVGTFFLNWYYRAKELELKEKSPGVVIHKE